MLPSFSYRHGEDRIVPGKDWWSYGIEANRKALEVILRDHYDQGITNRLVKIEDIFVPKLLTT